MTFSPSNVSDPFLRAFEILSHVAADRSCVYRWLSLGFYAPDAALVEAICSGKLKQEWLDATSWLGKDQQSFLTCLNGLDQYTNVSLAELQDSHESLFGKSVERVSAREAAYCWRAATHPIEVVEEVNHTLINIYGQYGLKPRPGMEDSLPVELEFLSYLCQVEAKEWQAQASKTAREMRRQERAFLTDHLGRWLPEFCQRVDERMDRSFYSVLSALAIRWLKLEHGSGYVPPLK